MAKLALRCPGLQRSVSRLAGVLVVGGALFGVALTADAQAPKQAKPDPKAAAKEKDKAEPKVEAKETPKADLNALPGPKLDEALKTVNELISAKWKNEKGEEVYKTAERCNDYEFIRRASLDIIGRIAKVEEINRYMKDPPATRRRQLVDRLLTSPEYSKNWSTIWTHWLMTRTGEALYKDQIQLWLEEEMFSQDNMSLSDMAQKLIAANGKTNDKGEVNYILAHLGGPTVTQGTQNPELTLQKEGQFDMVPVTSRTVRLFLGYQIQCTQCHDHPFNADWKQKHFWGVNAFFRQTERIGAPVNRMQQMQGMQQPMTLTDNPNYNKSGIVLYEKRNGVFLPSEPMFLDGSKLTRSTVQLGTRRENLARFVTNHKNFSKAYVNRMWAHFFSRGMNEKPAADDFGEHNPVIQEDLLDKVGELFTAANHNPKQLIRWVCNSEAYQLKAVANKSNDKAEDEVYFSRQMLKVMSPEQLLESLIVATRPNVAKDDDSQKKFRQDWMTRLVVNFGDDEGNELNFNGTVVQALLMMNGRDINNAISAESGTVQSAKSKTGKALVDHLFLATLNRPATTREFDLLNAQVRKNYGLREADVMPAMQDLFWALLNCNEFILNH
jgi:hypothetical protein